EEEFESEGAGWERGRYHSPDVMIAGRSEEEIERGEYLVVLGELHMALNTLRTPVFVGQHPCPKELFEAVERDMHKPCIIPLLPADESSGRGVVALFSPKDYLLEMDANSPSPSKSQTLTIGSLVVERGEKGLVVRSLDHDLQFDIIEVLSEPLTR